MSVLLVRSAAAESEAPTADEATAPAPKRRAFAGPFTSSRLFAMPIADVVGAYQLSLSYDGSLLQEPGVLSSAGVLAIGFGDIAQLEYRHTSAISVEGTNAPVPAIGVQLKLPLPEGKGWPAVAVAYRLGRPRTERFDALTVDEKVTDVYFVGRMKLGPITVHGGARVSSATIEVLGAAPIDEQRQLVLPAAGIAAQMNPEAELIAEVGLVPAFELDLDAPDEPMIGTAVMGRAGMRWRVFPALSLDATVGYQVESERLGTANMRGAGAVVDWGIRLGGEVFVPWGALACGSLGIFCD